MVDVFVGRHKNPPYFYFLSIRRNDLEKVGYAMKRVYHILPINVTFQVDNDRPLLNLYSDASAARSLRDLHGDLSMAFDILTFIKYQCDQTLHYISESYDRF